MCEECGHSHGAKSPLVVGPQPISPNLIWLATLLGGALAGYAVAIWNGRLLRTQSVLRTAVYALLGGGGWLLSIFLIAHLTPPAGGEPGFGIPAALALSFLLVSIPYNHDSLAALQWIWSHPQRKLVLNIGRVPTGLAYTSFAAAEGELFGQSGGTRPLVAIPVWPVIVVAGSALIGIITVLLGNAFAVK